MFHMKLSLSIHQTYECLLSDIVTQTGVHLDLPDDINEWAFNQGPALDKLLLTCIERSDHHSRYEIDEKIPAWLKPLWDVVSPILTFRSGVCTPPMEAVRALRWFRTLCLLCYKLERPFKTDQVAKAIDAFTSVEAELGKEEFLVNLFSRENMHMLREMRRLIGRIIYRCDGRNLNNMGEIPMVSHGPGAVFPSRPAMLKSKFTTIYSTIERYWPFAEWFIGVPLLWDPGIVQRQAEILEVESISCNLIAVPKDSRGPRLICVHPTEAIWIQQGLRHQLESAITTSPLTRGKINFDDQTVNQRLARESSVDGYFCTLDLRDASDRVHKDLVNYLFGDYSKFLNACRADQVVIKSPSGTPGTTLQLNKFAPMGNALTFPVEALVFWACVRSCIRSHCGQNCDDIYVFGDDIVFPSQYRDVVVKGLTKIGLAVNEGKTFSKGLFRESCGVDAFNGFDVTPFRLRKDSVSSPDGAMATCDLAKRLTMSCYHSKLANYLYRLVNSHWHLFVSNNDKTSGIYRLVRGDLASLMCFDVPIRYNRQLHRWESRYVNIRGESFSPPHGAWWPLIDALTRKGEISDQPIRYAIPSRVKTKLGWTPVL